MALCHCPATRGNGGDAYSSSGLIGVSSSRLQSLPASSGLSQWRQGFTRTPKSVLWKLGEGEDFLVGYVLPLLMLSAVQVGVLAYEAGEFGQLARDCRPSKTEVSAGFPKNMPPRTPWPGLRRVTGILTAWLWASVWFPLQSFAMPRSLALAFRPSREDSFGTKIEEVCMFSGIFSCMPYS